ncbi:MAG: FadR family transcriptional regulator [Saprospiraceae bacterium]|jgi:GntR family transcriptional repressor for pyruvate dehydrogenase complex|nr:FadR family transcriptional regulator [Saprospiraceae bacterium]
MLDNLQKIKIDKPVDKIIGQIKSLISNGEIKPGDKLPSERALADHLGVGRSHVREAILKLEFYGILKTYPQNGTFVSGIGIVALEELISDVLNLEEHDFKSLVETRVLLEKQAAYLAAKRRTSEDIASISNALSAYEKKTKTGQQAVEEDLLFHIKIAEASKNNVLKSLMMIITPDIVKNYINLKVCDDLNFNKTLQEHQAILESIINQDPEAASAAMAIHLKDVSEFSESVKDLQYEMIKK